MLCAQLPAHSSRASNDHWHLELTTTGVVQHATVVGNLWEGKIQNMTNSCETKRLWEVRTILGTVAVLLSLHVALSPDTEALLGFKKASGEVILNAVPTWLNASSKKPMFMPSTMGRRPVMAAPMPIPMKPFSACDMQ